MHIYLSGLPQPCGLRKDGNGEILIVFSTPSLALPLQG
jgi:hypothetical protein